MPVLILPSYRALPVTYTTGPGCSKLTMSSVNVSLKFQIVISQIRQYFVENMWEAKASLIVSTKNISVIGYKAIKHIKIDLLTSSLS